MSTRTFRPGPAARTLAALLVAAGVVLVAGLPAQEPAKQPAPPKKPRTEEEDTPPPLPPKPGKADKPAPANPVPAPKQQTRTEPGGGPSAAPKQSPRTEEDEAPAKPLPSAAAAGGRDLGELARRVRNPYLRKLYGDFAVPHDVFHIKSGTNPEHDEVVAPVAVYVGDDPKGQWHREMGVQRLDRDGKPIEKPWHPDPVSIKAIRYYEQLAVSAVDEFLRDQEALAPDNKYKLPRDEQLAAAEAVLTAAARFHESAKAAGLRKGDDWEDNVEAPLRARLLDVRLEQLDGLAKAAQWDAGFELTKVLAREYPKKQDQARIAKPLIDYLAASFRSATATDQGLRQNLQRLRDLEDVFPDRKALEQVSAGLRQQARRFLDLAKQLVEKQQPDKAIEVLNQAVEFAPDDNEIRTMHRNLVRTHHILRVGVRSLPEEMSPARATTDSEIRAVELMFESLVKLGYDPRGNARYEPGLAETLPRAEPLARRFLVPRNAYWSDGQSLTAHDVRGTLDRLMKGKEGGAWGTLLFDASVVTDPYRVTIRMRQGYIDPLSLTNFKVVPPHLDADSEAFARHPVGSGPYHFDRVDSEGGHQYLAFAYNPQYGNRPGREGLPRIREIRFFATVGYDPSDPARRDPAGEMKRHEAPLDVMLDLTTEHAAALAAVASAEGIHVRKPARAGQPGGGSRRSRRVYFLALNQKKPPLNQPDVRKALAHAIDREKVLDQCFRQKVASNVVPSLGRLHVALNGPYPADSWACNPKSGGPLHSGSLDLFDLTLARKLLQGVRAKGELPGSGLTLSYPDDDPALKPAVEEICKQYKEVLGLRVAPAPRNPRDLRKEVESVTYDLAYYHYDFPDETYWLWPLFAPRGSENIFGAQPDRLEGMFLNAAASRYFPKVKSDTWKIHDELCETMPLVPLWQLDPLAAVHSCVEAPPFDPVIVFNEIERWNVEPR